jgi:hypothetical protein
MLHFFDSRDYYSIVETDSLRCLPLLIILADIGDVCAIKED